MSEGWSALARRRNKQRGRRLRLRILAALATLSVLPLAALGLFLYVDGEAALREQTFERLDTLVLLKTQQIESWMKERRHDVVRPTSVPVVRSAALRVASAAVRGGSGAEGLRRALEQARTSGELLEMAVLDPAGRVLLSTDASREGEVAQQWPGAAGGDTALLVEYDPAVGRSRIGFAAPVRDAAGTARAFLLGRLDFGFVDRLMAERAGLGASGRTFLVDRLGRVISDTRGFDGRGARSPVAGGPQQASGRPAGTGLWVNEDGGRVAGAYRWIPELELALVAELDEGEAFAAVRRLGLVLAAVVVAVASLALLFGLALAVRLGRLERRLEERTVESEGRRRAAEALAEVGRLVSATLDAAVVAERIVESVGTLLGARSAAVFRLVPASGELVGLATAGELARHMQRDVVLPPDAGTVGLAVRERRPIATPDVLTDSRVQLPPELHGVFAAMPHRAVLAVPLLVKDEVIGAIAIGAEAGRVFTAAEVRLVRAFADHAAVALENARLYEAAHGAYRDLSRTQAQLLHVQKMEAVARLAGGVAHEFNNLLTVVSGRAQLLLKRLPGTDPSRHDVDTIDKAARRVAALTRQLLAFSRHQTLSPSVLRPGDVVTGLAAMLRRTIGEQVEVEIRVEPGLDAVTADRGQLEQVILNLAVNARDAMPGGGRLLVETRGVEVSPEESRRLGVPAGPWACIAVADTGCGIAAGIRGRIFEPFFTTKEIGRGSGLGLATVYGIVTQSGGHVTVESEPGRGTTFRIYLPVTATVEPTSVAPRPAAPVHATVLVVEDEVAVRQLTRDVLRAHGFTVLDCGDGEEGLRVAAGHDGRIDLLLTDVVMPRMSGLELARRFRSAYPVTPVLFMTGYTDETLVPRAAFDAGQLLLKPFTPDELGDRVHSALAGGPLPMADPVTSDLAAS